MLNLYNAPRNTDISYLVMKAYFPLLQILNHKWSRVPLSLRCNSLNKIAFS